MKHPSRLLRYAAVILALGTGHAYAETGWGVFKSETGSYTVLLPNTHDVKSSQMRLDDKSLVFSEEVTSVLDQRPYRDTVKRYIVKMDQTFGPTLNDAEMKSVIETEAQTYKDFYGVMGGVLKSEENVLLNGYPARDFYISYQDPDLGPQGIRVLITMTESAKFQQIIMGTDDVMYAYKSKDYFASLGVRRGLSMENGIFAEDWVAHTVPSQIFTVKLPAKNPPFVLSEPALAQKPDTEIITDTIYDPVRQEKIYYTVTSHTFQKPMTFRDAEEVALTLHLSKFKINFKGVGFGRSSEGEFPFITLEAPIAAPKEIPYARYVRMKATFYANYMVVQELVGSQALARSDFASNMMGQMTFHPQKAEALKNQVAAPTETPVEAPVATETPVTP